MERGWLGKRMNNTSSLLSRQELHFYWQDSDFDIIRCDGYSNGVAQKAVGTRREGIKWGK